MERTFHRCAAATTVSAANRTADYAILRPTYVRKAFRLPPTTTRLVDQFSDLVYVFVTRVSSSFTLYRPQSEVPWEAGGIPWLDVPHRRLQFGCRSPLNNVCSFDSLRSLLCPQCSTVEILLPFPEHTHHRRLEGGKPDCPGMITIF